MFVDLICVRHVGTEYRVWVHLLTEWEILQFIGRDLDLSYSLTGRDLDLNYGGKEVYVLFKNCEQVCWIDNQMVNKGDCTKNWLCVQKEVVKEVLQKSQVIQLSEEEEKVVCIDI